MYTQMQARSVEWRAMLPTCILTAVNERRRQANRSTLPLTKDFTGLRFVSHAKLVFDQGMSFPNIMAQRGIGLTGLDAGTLRDIFIEMLAIPEPLLTIHFLRVPSMEAEGPSM